MKITRYQIELRDVHIHAHHGVMPQERCVGAEFTLNATLTIDDHSCADSDNIAATVSYADVYEIIKEEMKQPSNLLEHVCNRIMQRIFNEHRSVSEITITLHKDTPPMGGDRLTAGVTMNGKRE